MNADPDIDMRNGNRSALGRYSAGLNRYLETALIAFWSRPSAAFFKRALDSGLAGSSPLSRSLNTSKRLLLGVDDQPHHANPRYLLLRLAFYRDIQDPRVQRNFACGFTAMPKSQVTALRAIGSGAAMARLV